MIIVVVLVLSYSWRCDDSHFVHIVYLDRLYILLFGRGFEFSHNGSISSSLTEIWIPGLSTEMTEVLFYLEKDAAQSLQFSPGERTILTGGIFTTLFS